MITVTLAVVCYSTAASSYDGRVVLVSLGVSEDPAPPPPRDAPRRVANAAAGGAAIASELVMQCEDDEEVAHLHAEANAETQEAYLLNALLQEGGSEEVGEAGVAAAAARPLAARFPGNVDVARRVVERWRAFVAERKGVLLLRLIEELPDLFDAPTPLLDLAERHPVLFAVEVLQRLDPVDRTMLAQVGRPWLAVLVSGLPRMPNQGSDGASPSQGVMHVCRAAGLGQGEWVPMGGVGPELVDQPLCTRRSRWAPGGVAVGAAAPLPVEREDVLCRR
jgi:hypothetical protein